MRHTIKPLLVALLALLALAALTSTSASAATCKKGALEAEHKTLCVEGKQVGSSTENVTTEVAFKQKTGTSAVIEVPLAGWSVVCTEVATYLRSSIVSGGSGQVRLENLGLNLAKCKAFIGEREEPECEVKGLGTFGLTSSLANPENIELTTSSGSFGTLVINGCALSGNIPVKGSQGCSLKQPEVEAIAKELVCEPKNSKLTFGGGYLGPPKLKLEGNLELAGTAKGKKFSITK
jgi:hypothetical protein